MTTSGPYLAAALLCERVLKEQDGVSSFIRVVDRFTITAEGPDVADEMPHGSISLWAVIILKAGDARGRDAVQLIVEKPSGRRSEVASLPVVFEPEDRGVELLLELTLGLDEEGLYWIDVELKRPGRLLTRIPLRIIWRPITQRQGQ